LTSTIRLFDVQVKIEAIKVRDRARRRLLTAAG
jgi:hypothetical protein